MSVDLDVTNNSTTKSVTLRRFTHNTQGTLDPIAEIVVLEPGAGTAITISDHSLLVVRDNDTHEALLPLSVAHTADETTSTEPTPI